MHSGDPVVKGPPLLCEIGKASSQSRIWMEDPHLVFFKKGFEHIPGRGHSMFKGVDKQKCWRLKWT